MLYFGITKLSVEMGPIFRFAGKSVYKCSGVCQALDFVSFGVQLLHMKFNSVSIIDYAVH